jgi:outer membrane protein assembly factor BamB
MKIKIKFIILFIFYICIITCNNVKNPHLWNYIVDQKLFDLQFTEFKIVDQHIILRTNNETRNGQGYLENIIILNKENGKKIWEIKSAGEPIFINRNILYCMISNNRENNKQIIAFNLDNGNIEWEMNLNKDLSGYIGKNTIKSVDIKNNILIIMIEPPLFSDIDITYCFDIFSGDFKYSFPFSYDKKLFIFDKKNNLMYFLHQNAQDIYIVDALTGKIVKEIRGRKILVREIKKNGDVLVCFSYKNDIGVFGLSILTGEIIWGYKDIKPYQMNSLIVKNDTAYIIGNEIIVALDVNSGELIWKNTNIKSYLRPAPFNIENNKLYYPQFKPKNEQVDVFTIDLDTGKILKKTDINKPIWPSFIYQKGVIYYQHGNSIIAEKVNL